jgi:hypothetical protein
LQLRQRIALDHESMGALVGGVRRHDEVAVAGRLWLWLWLWLGCGLRFPLGLHFRLLRRLGSARRFDTLDLSHFP